MKRVISFAIILVLLLSLAACGVSNTPAAEPQNDPSGQSSSAAGEPAVKTTDAPFPTDEDVFVPSVTEPPVPETVEIPAEYSVFENVLTVPVKLYAYDELSESTELGDALTYLHSVQDMELPNYSPQAFCVTDDGEIAIADTISARLMVFDAASGSVKRIVKVGEVNSASPIRVTKSDGVYYVLIPYYNARIVAVNPDDTTAEIRLSQLEEVLNYSQVTEFYVENGKLIMTLVTDSSITTKAVSLADGSVTTLYKTEWKLAGGVFTVTRDNRTWSFPAEPTSGTRAARIDVLKVDGQGNLHVIQEVPVEGQEDDGLYQVYDPDGRMIACYRIKYFPDQNYPARYGRIIGADGALYEMYCNDNEVRIVRLATGE